MKTPLNKNYLVAGLMVTVLAGGGIAYFLLRPTAPQPPAQAQSASLADPSSYSDSSDTSDAETTDQPELVSKAPGAPSTSGKANRNVGEQAGGHAFENPLANTPEEANWLRAAGYPSVDDLQTLGVLDRRGLEVRAASGDDLANTLLGAQLAVSKDKGRLKEGLDRLESSVLNGSVFALSELANVHQMHGKTMLAEGYRMAAYLRGDYGPAFVFHLSDGMLIPSKSAYDRPLGIVLGQSILDRINSERGRRGMGPLAAPQPRPGAEQAFIYAQQEIGKLANSNP